MQAAQGKRGAGTAEMMVGDGCRLKEISRHILHSRQQLLVVEFGVTHPRGTQEIVTTEAELLGGL